MYLLLPFILSLIACFSIQNCFRWGWEIDSFKNQANILRWTSCPLPFRPFVCDEPDNREEITSEGFWAVADRGGPKGEKPEGDDLNVHFFPGGQGTKPQTQEGKHDKEEVGGGTCGNGGLHRWYPVPLGSADAMGCPVNVKKCVVFGLRGGSLSSFLSGSKAKPVFQVQGRSRIKRSRRRVKKAAG